ncbi:hypothetical protein [Chitinophaga sp.]|uniref:hypothetical protein n=1 Tax=Chitinophaga sp. TaxID=1869181 RepID=UPI002F92EA56
MEDVLTYRKYKEIIETCEMLLSPETIRNHVEAYHQKYQKDNPFMSIALMEIIEHEYPQIDLIEDESIAWISIFDDLGKSIDKPQLRYLYTLLFTGKYTTQLQGEINEVEANVSQQNEQHLFTTEPFTFKSDFDADDLLSLYDWLIQEEFISEFGKDNFQLLFSGLPFNELNGRKLTWSISNTYGNDNEALFNMLFVICPDEYPSGRYYADFLRKIITYITPSNASKFNYSALRKAFRTWRKNGKKKPKRHSNSDKLLTFLRKSM